MSKGTVNLSVEEYDHLKEIESKSVIIYEGISGTKRTVYTNDDAVKVLAQINVDAQNRIRELNSKIHSLEFNFEQRISNVKIKCESCQTNNKNFSIKEIALISIAVIVGYFVGRLLFGFIQLL